MLSEPLLRAMPMSGPGHNLESICSQLSRSSVSSKISTVRVQPRKLPIMLHPRAHAQSLMQQVLVSLESASLSISAGDPGEGDHEPF